MNKMHSLKIQTSIKIKPISIFLKTLKNVWKELVILEIHS